MQSVRSTPKHNRPGLTAIVQVLIRTDVNAHYDKRMVAAVKRWQRRLGVTEDGLIGPMTIRAYLSGVGAQRRGCKGSPVQLIQYIAGIRAHGTFDEATEKAVMQLQKSAGLRPDGVFGPECVKHLVV